MNNDYSDVQTAARIESSFTHIAEIGQDVAKREFELGKGDNTDDYGLPGYKVLDTGVFYKDHFDNDGKTVVPNYKAVVLEDSAGNIIVHFNGTGNQNWKYNPAAYGPEESEMQLWASRYLDEAIEKYCYKDGKRTDAKLIVSGHSQGGNNAVYSVLNSKYADDVSKCLSLDGPNLSHDVADNIRAMLGDEEYERRCRKLYGYYGQYDFVSPLGQESAIPDDHIYLVETSRTGYRTDGLSDKDRNNPLFQFHAGNFMLDKDGNIIAITPYSDPNNGESDFRKLVLALNDKINKLPREEQYDLAQSIMRILDKDPVDNPLTQRDIDLIREQMVPIIVETLKENPAMTGNAIADALIIALNIPEENAGSIRKLIVAIASQFGEMPTDMQIQALNSIIINCVTVDSNGNIELDFSLQKIIGLVWDNKVAAYHVVRDMLVENGGDIVAALHAFGVDKMLVEYVKEHPVKALIVTLLLPVVATEIIKRGWRILVVMELVNFFVDVVGKIEQMYNKLKNFMVSMCQFVQSVIQPLHNWITKTFNKGMSYARNNPQISIDTGKFYELAGRLQRVNSRIISLDSAMDSLYWQVGLLDIKDILVANLLAHWSPTLRLAQSYLTSTADSFESAERSIQSMWG